MTFDQTAEKVMQLAVFMALKMNSELLTPEHLLNAALDEPVFKHALHLAGGDPELLTEDLEEFIDTVIPKRKEDSKNTPDMTEMVSDAFASSVETAMERAEKQGAEQVMLSHLIYGVSQQSESFAAYFLEKEVGSIKDFNTLFWASTFPTTSLSHSVPIPVLLPS